LVIIQRDHRVGVARHPGAKISTSGSISGVRVGIASGFNFERTALTVLLALFAPPNSSLNLSAILHLIYHWDKETVQLPKPRFTQEL
jgi:phage shock protein PspC (stress-responsive transcriptional regulator)